MGYNPLLHGIVTAFSNCISDKVNMLYLVCMYTEGIRQLVCVCVYVCVCVCVCVYVCLSVCLSVAPMICSPQTLLWHILDFPDYQTAFSGPPCIFKLTSRSIQQLYCFLQKNYAVNNLSYQTDFQPSQPLVLSTLSKLHNSPRLFTCSFYYYIFQIFIMYINYLVGYY